jgi:Tfp pilus assembly protein PilO
MTQRFSFARFDAIAVTVIVVISAVAYQFGYRPLSRARAEVLATNESLAQLLTGIEKAQAELKNEKAIVASLQQQVGTILRFEPASTLNRRMGIIPELGERAGVRIREVVPKAGVPGDRLVRIPITISGEGPSNTFPGLLAALNRECRDMEVMAFSVLARPENPNEPVRFSLDLCWYALSGSAASTASQNAVTSERP